MHSSLPKKDRTISFEEEQDKKHIQKTNYTQGPDKKKSSKNEEKRKKGKKEWC